MKINETYPTETHREKFNAGAGGKLFGRYSSRSQ